MSSASPRILGVSVWTASNEVFYFCFRHAYARTLKMFWKRGLLRPILLEPAVSHSSRPMLNLLYVVHLRCGWASENEKVTGCEITGPQSIQTSSRRAPGDTEDAKAPKEVSPVAQREATGKIRVYGMATGVEKLSNPKFENCASRALPLGQASSSVARLEPGRNRSTNPTGRV